MQISNPSEFQARKSISVPKNHYSEWVVRKSLYWVSEFCQWELKENHDSWDVNLIAQSDDIEQGYLQFNRLLNDFKLREQHDKNTLQLRQRIIKAALTRIADSNEPG